MGLNNLEVNCYWGHTYAEETILKIAYAYEQVTDWHKRRAGI